MKKTTWKSYTFRILLTESVGALSGRLAANAAKLYTETILRPPLSPPGIVFPIVWSILFALMGIGAARISSTPASAARSRSLQLFWLQLAFNFCWSLIFFRLQAYGPAFIWLLLLWFLILRMIMSFRKVDPPAAALQIPYLLWVSFAAYLNFGVWMLNP